jgi:uncharacterized membrane protein YdjX (TVP38/TMEM64 family)
MLHKSIRWLLLAAIILSIILIPWFLWGERIESWSHDLIQTATVHAGWVAATLALLLATDVLVPAPSSVVSTALGFLLGFPGGSLASWAAMTASSTLGYWLARSGRPLTRRLIGDVELEHLDALGRRLGSWMVVVCRPIPVLAEASVLFVGMAHMPMGHFLLLTALSNLGISMVYAAIGAYSASLNSFLLAFVGAILVPLIGMGAMDTRKRKHHRGAVTPEGEQL